MNNSKNTIFELKLPKDKWFILWDIALSSFFVFAFTYSLTFFAPFLLGAKVSRKNSSSDFAIKIIGYFLENPEVAVTISLTAVFIYLFINSRKNKKINYIYKAEKDNQNIKLFLSNKYFNKFKEIEIPLSNLLIDFKVKINGLGSSNKLMIFKTKDTNETIGIIYPNHFLWDKKILMFKRVVTILSPFINSNIEKQKEKNIGQKIFE